LCGSPLPACKTWIEVIDPTILHVPWIKE
jgi:hypothetical protein